MNSRAVDPKDLKTFWPLRYRKGYREHVGQIWPRGPQLATLIVRPDGTEICAGDDPYAAVRQMSHRWEKDGTISALDIPCICGAKKIGAPDYSLQHSSWCYLSFFEVP